MMILCATSVEPEKIYVDQNELNKRIEVKKLNFCKIFIYCNFHSGEH